MCPNRRFIGNYSYNRLRSIYGAEKSLFSVFEHSFRFPQNRHLVFALSCVPHFSANLNARKLGLMPKCRSSAEIQLNRVRFSNIIVVAFKS